MDGTRLPLFPSIRSAVTAAATAYVIACACSSGFAQSGAIMIPIEKMNVGTALSEFESARTGQGGLGTWRVVADATAAGGRAIEQTSTDRTDYRFPLAIYKPLSARNIDVVVRFKPVAGKVDRAGGIAVRLVDSDNYYVVRANALEDNVRFYRMVKGRREQIAGVDVKVPAGAWHTLGLKAENDRFTISFDGKTLYGATDKTFADAGRVALWTKADSVTRFDRIEINTLP
jgi:hypothetical protein